MLQPDYERFVSTTAAPFFEAGDAGPNARQNFFCARLVTDASMAARAEEVLPRVGALSLIHI